MLAFLQYLLAIVIGSSGLAPPEGPATAPDVAGIALTIVAFGVASSTWGVLGARRVSEDADRAVPGFLRTVAVGRITALAVYWFVAQTLHGVSLAHWLGIADWILVPHIVRLLPFALLLMALRAGLHPIGRRLRLEPPGIVGTWLLEARQAMLPLGPLVPVLVVWDVIALAVPSSWLGAVREVFFRLPVAQAFLSLGMLLGALVLMPFLLRLVWGAKPLPAGPLRERLDAYSQRIGLRARDILVWPTGEDSLNAAVVGAFPRLRYVFLTDALVNTLDDEEVEAVFAHEAGHARRGHVLLFFGFTAVLILASLLPAALGRGWTTPLAAVDPLVRTLVMVLAWLGVVMGWVSRRFEQEADVFGLDTLPLPDTAPDPAQHPFARALERIAAETGGIREITGWRHFSIADRVEFVRAYLTDPTVRARYRRSIRLLRGTLIALIGGFTLIAATQVPAELSVARRIWETARNPEMNALDPLRRATTPAHRLVRARSFLEAALLAQRAGHDGRALRWLRSAAALAPDQLLVMDTYARALEAAGRPRGAARAWQTILALPDLPDAERERAEAALAALPSRAD